jgi:hypothetical protein
MAPLMAAARLGVHLVDAQLGHDVGVELDHHCLLPRPDFCTITSGTTMLASRAKTAAPAWARRRHDQRLRLAHLGLVCVR